MSDELIDYVKKSLANKVPEAVIKENLQKSGWSTDTVEKVFQQLNNSPNINESTTKMKSMRGWIIWTIVYLLLFFGVHPLLFYIRILLGDPTGVRWPPQFFALYIFEYIFSVFQIFSIPIVILLIIVFAMKSFFSKTNSVNTQAVTQGLGQDVPPNKTNNRKRNIIIFVLFLLFSFATTPIYFFPPDGLFIRLGFFGSEQSLQKSELAGAAIVSMAAIVAIPVFAGLLSTFTILGLNWLKEKQAKRILAYIFLGVVGLGVALPAYIIISFRVSQNKEIGSIPSKVSFRTYKPNKNHPFNSLHENYQISKSPEKKCVAIEYEYYGSSLGPDLIERSLDSKGCPEEFYTKFEQYETFKKIADTEALDFESKIISKKVNGESVLIERNGKGNYFNSIYGVKSSTLIKVMGACTVDENQQNCEQKYLDFYASLEPLK